MFFLLKVLIPLVDVSAWSPAAAECSLKLEGRLKSREVSALLLMRRHQLWMAAREHREWNRKLNGANV